jgi:hypothetical protein
MQKASGESPRLGSDLERLERDVRVARAAVAAGQEPIKTTAGEHPHRLEERHRALLQSYARAVLREALEGKPPTISTWVSDEREPLCIRRLQVIEAVQKQIAQWEADKAAGRLLPPVHDAPKYGDQIVDNLA